MQRLYNKVNHVLLARNIEVLLVQFGVTVAYALVAYCYFGVAYTGYNAFGSQTAGQILYSLGHPVWVVCMASIFVIVHVCGSFQVKSLAWMLQSMVVALSVMRKTNVFRGSLMWHPERCNQPKHIY